jgi:acetyltransferase-like isoleucine patch superfamily enzyme
MANFFLYVTFIVNLIKYKFRFQESGRFYIRSNSSIMGFKMISLGKNFAANRFLRIEAIGDHSKIKLKIGDFVSVGESVHIAANNYVEIKNNVLIGSRVLITDHNHGSYSGDNQCSPFEIPSKRALFSSGVVIIHENVWLGDGVVILPNVEIGFGTIVAANSVVTKSLPPYCIAGGIPCKVFKNYNKDSQIWENLN